MTTQPTTPVSVNADMSPFALEATDDNGNRDQGFAAAVSLSHDGGGNLASSDGGLSKSFAAGTISWSNLSYDAAETIHVTATSGTLAVDTNAVDVQ